MDLSNGFDLAVPAGRVLGVTFSESNEICVTTASAVSVFEGVSTDDKVGLTHA